jgi:hypothetical protein
MKTLTTDEVVNGENSHTFFSTVFKKEEKQVSHTCKSIPSKRWKNGCPQTAAPSQQDASWIEPT